MGLKNIFYTKGVDKIGRLVIPDDLFYFAHPLLKKDVALCYKDDDSFVLKNIEDVMEEDIVIYIRCLDDKKRLTIPSDMRKKFSCFEMYIMNHKIIIRGVN